MRTVRTLMWGVAPAILLAFNICASADTIPPATQIQVRTDQPIDMQTFDGAQVYPARVVQDVYDSNGNIAIPRGSYAELAVRLVGVGRGEMALDLASVTVNGTRYVMDTRGSEENLDATRPNLGFGSTVGAFTGRSEMETRGPQIYVPEDSVVTFVTQAPVNVVIPECGDECRNW
jgi:hypothetical protein